MGFSPVSVRRDERAFTTKLVPPLSHRPCRPIVTRPATRALKPSKPVRLKMFDPSTTTLAHDITAKDAAKTANTLHTGMTT
jgi:hypothetical protein